MAGKDGWTDKVTIEHEGQRPRFIEALKAINTTDGLQEVRARDSEQAATKGKASLH